MSTTASCLQYLDAIGVQVWEERAVPVVLDFNTRVEAQDLSALYAVADACQRCDAANSRQQIVFSTGPSHADWLVIGDVPSEHDDAQGQPFSDQAGRLLFDMMLAVGVKSSAVHVTNSVKCHASAIPSDSRFIACREYLIRQIELVQPKVVLVLGELSAQRLLKSNLTLNALRSEVQSIDGLSMPVVVSEHPRVLMDAPSSKRQVWKDLQLAVTVVT